MVEVTFLFQPWCHIIIMASCLWVSKMRKMRKDAVGAVADGWGRGMVRESGIRKAFSRHDLG